MVYALPESTLAFLKPLLGELLAKSVLTIDPSANVNDMDDVEKILFLRAFNKKDTGEYVSFEDALAACGVDASEI